MKKRYDEIFIGVNYCSSNETLQWAEVLLESEDSRLIIIVDNSCEYLDMYLEENLKTLSEEIIYINSGKNLGYLPAANFGYNKIREDGIEFDYLIVSNVDLSFETKNIKKQLDAVNKDNIGVFAPTILNGDVDLNPYRIYKQSEKEIQNRLMYYKYYKLQPVINIYRNIKNKIKKNIIREYKLGTEMYMAYGACFIFNEIYFLKGGNLSHELFLYGEENFVAEQCISLGLKIVYVPTVIIKNKGHVSTGKLKRKIHSEYLVEATEYVLENYY